MPRPSLPSEGIGLATSTATVSTVFTISRRALAKRRSLTPGEIEPMYATIGTDVPKGSSWTFEPKYDGMRTLAFVSRSRVHLMTRNGRDKAAQFPEVVAALRSLATQLERPIVLDGEIVATARSSAGRFQALQGRFHLKSDDTITRRAGELPAVLIAFDMLRDGGDILLDEPWTMRRERLLNALAEAPKGLRVSESAPNGARMIARARRAGWEGVMAKRTDAPYVPGARSREWLKLKLQYRAEFVVGGFTEPRRTRKYLGAILLGYFDDGGKLQYVGHTGGGFTRESLRDMHDRLTRLEQARSPFENTPHTNERAHWVRPRTVVEVKFAEWTEDAKLRQPIFLGVRDDKNARDVHLERESLQQWTKGAAADREVRS